MDGSCIFGGGPEVRFWVGWLVGWFGVVVSLVVDQKVGTLRLLLLGLRRLLSETPKSALARRPIPLMIQPLLSRTVTTFYWALEEMLPRKMLRVSRELELLHDTIGGEIGIEACTALQTIQWQ